MHAIDPYDRNAEMVGSEILVLAGTTVDVVRRPFPAYLILISGSPFTTAILPVES